MNELRFHLHHLVSGRQLDIYGLGIDGHSEVFDFLRRCLQDEPALYRDLKNIMAKIADVFYAAPNAWLRRIHAWPGR